MSMKKVMLTGALLTLAHTAHALDFRPIAGYEWATMSGDIQDGTAVLSLKDDLGIEDSDNLLLGFQLGALGQRLSFRYLPYSFSGNSTLSRSIDFGDETFNLNAPLATTLDLTEYAADYRFAPLSTPVGYVGVGFGVNMFESEVTLVSGNTVSRSTATIPLPTVGIAAGIHLPFTGLSLNADLSGVSFQDNRYRNGEVNLDYSPAPLVGIRVGYRDRELVLEEDDLMVDITMSGPFAAVWVGF